MNTWTIFPQGFISILVDQCYWIKAVSAQDMVQQEFPSNTFHGIKLLF